MAQINYGKVLRLYEQRGAQAADAAINEQFRSREIRPQDVDIGRLFAECYGWHSFMECRAGRELANRVMARSVMEAEGAVSTAAFLNITNQFVYQTVLDNYEAEASVFTALIPEAQASSLDGELIPGITEIGDELAVRKEGDAYALAGLGENWIRTPPVPDVGMEVALTWEATFKDKTGRLADNAAQVGKWAGVRREKGAIDCVVDENTTSHRYHWRNNVIASYGNNSGNHTWDNLEASNALVDGPTSLNAAEQLFNGLVDPFTGEPISIDPKHLVVTKQLEATASYILSATMLNRHVGGYATSGNLTQAEYQNPWRSKYELKTSRLLASRMATDTDWFLGDYTKYAKCMIAEKMNVQQAPAGNDAEFHRRIVTIHRVNERFAYVVVEPRAAVKNTA